jgi:hypothetical protein
VEYVALIEGGAMGKTEDREERKEDRGRTNIEHPPAAVCVICHNSDKKILNKRSQTCGACYQAWNVGKIEHPTLGKFKSSLTKSKITKEKKPKSPVIPVEETWGRKPEVDEPIMKTPTPVIPAEAGHAVKHSAIQENALCADGIIIKLDKYPRIKHQIDFLADRYLVNPEHVIIGLIGEALAARRERKESV